MCDELVKRLRTVEEMLTVAQFDEARGLVKEAADALEELSLQRDRAYSRLCEWCGVCPVDRRNLEDCEIAAIYPEAPKTWADTIRAMTDEQLAEAFMAAEKYGRIHNGGRTLEWWLDFLRQEAAEDTNVPGKSYLLFTEEGRITL